MEFIKVIPKKIDKKDYSLLVKHNNLIQGKYYLEASEQKLLYKIFEEIQKKSYTTRIVQINFQDFYNDYKSVLTKNITKKDFKNLIESLQDKKPYIIKGDEYIRTQWYKIYGKVDLSEVKLELDIDVFEYVQSLDKNFTGLRLETLYAFKSFHSMRIYELLKQWCETRTEIPYTVDSLKELLGIEDNAGYKNFFNFKKYVLDKALKEINEKSELTVEMETIKEGRKTVGVIFKIVDIKKSKVLKDEKIDDVSIKPDDLNFVIPKELKLDERLNELFKNQFKEYDFGNPDYMATLFEAEGITLLKDNASSINSLNYKLFSSILKNKIDDLEKRKRIEAEQEEESRYWLLLSEDERDDACRLNISCKTYYEIIKSPENSTDEELLPNF